MSQSLLAAAVMDQLRRRYPAYHETAYIFILSGLRFAIERIGEPRHVGGRELAEACRDLALDRWGPLARAVLEFWGICGTRDLGEIVFALVDCGVLIKRDEDHLDDFDGIFDFEQTFEHEYPWKIPAALVA